MPELKPNSKVSLEDLLRVKRAERPDAEFWSNFERELRQKQLTALVQKRRWWHGLPSLMTRRVYLPASAAAMAALAVIAVRYSNPVAVVPVHATLDQSAPAQIPVEMLPAVEIATSRVDAAAEYARKPSDPVPASEIATAEIDREAPLSVGLLPVGLEPAVADAPSSRTIAANLANLQESEPDLVNAVIGNRIAPAASTVHTATLAQNSAPRTHRLIARYAERMLDPNPVAPASVRERIARKLGDDLVDSFSRVAVEQGAVSVRF